MRRFCGAPRLVAAIVCALALAVTAACKKDLDKAPRDRDARLTPQQLFEKGEGYSRRGRYYRARQMLEKVLGRSNVPPDLVAKTNLAIADAYYYDGGVINVAEALSRYTSFLTYYPTNPRADYVQYQIGLCYLKQTLAPDKDQSVTRQALDAFLKVINTYPDGEYAKAAREKADVCRERLAEAEMRIGLFYLKRRAHWGAIERFRSILENYPRYSKRDLACFRLGEALRARGRIDEAAIYYRKVVEEHPKSRYAGQARQALRSTSGSPPAAAARP